MAISIIIMAFLIIVFGICMYKYYTLSQKTSNSDIKALMALITKEVIMDFVYFELIIREMSAEEGFSDEEWNEEFIAMAKKLDIPQEAAERLIKRIDKVKESK